MSSFPSRSFEVWQSSQARAIEPIHGAFLFELNRTLMVPQTLQFLAEMALSPPPRVGVAVQGFLRGMRYTDPAQPHGLLFCRDFPTAVDLFSVELEELSDAVRELEMHADINLTFSRVTYLADVGRGPELPLQIFSRLPLRRGVAFEVEERSAISHSLAQGAFILTDQLRVAQQHYSTGMALLAGEDQVTGLIDAAFMQFYLAVEAVLERHEKNEALSNGRARFGEAFGPGLERVVAHVYLARHRFFGHAHPKYLKGILDADTAFDIAKQTLVARWCARRLIELTLERPLVKREMRLYPHPGQSVTFSGDSDTLETDFALPK